MVEPYLAMKGFVPTCLTRWCSSFALALHAAEEQGKITEDRARLVVGAKVNRVKSRRGGVLECHAVASGSHGAGWSHSVQRWFEVGVRKASMGVVGVSATIRQHGKGSATCVYSRCGGTGRFQGCKAVVLLSDSRYRRTVEEVQGNNNTDGWIELRLLESSRPASRRRLSSRRSRCDRPSG